MQGDQPVLYVSASAHLLSASHQHSYLPGTDFRKQRLLFYLTVGVMDERDLILRDTLLHELLFQIVIYVERAVFGGRGQIAEYKLGRTLFFGLFPDFVDVPGADSHLAVWVVGSQRVDKTHIQGQLAPVIGNAQHIVHMGVNASIPDFFRPFRQPFHHLLLKLGRLDNLCVKVGLWHGKMEHICRLDVGHLFESGHQLRQIEKLGKPGLGPITGAFRGQLDGGDGFSKVAGPIVKMDEAHFLQQPVLQIPLDGVKLHHTVRDGGACGKNCAAPSGEFIQIATFHKEVGTFLRFGLGDPAYVAHFRH